MRTAFQPRYSNYQIVLPGQGGTTAGRIVTKKRFKSKKESYENALAEDIINTFISKQDGFPKNRALSQLRNKISKGEGCRYTLSKNKKIPKGEMRNALDNIVKEYNTKGTQKYLLRYLSRKGKKEYNLFKDYFDTTTNAKLYKIQNDEKYLFFMKNKSKILKIIV